MVSNTTGLVLNRLAEYLLELCAAQDSMEITLPLQTAF